MITISPGHWDVGTGARDILDEVTEARKVAKKVAQNLHASGVVVNYVEDNVSKNQSQNLSYIVKQHNSTNRQIDISIHFNASGNTTNKGIGTEVLYFTEKALAEKMSKAIASASGLIDRGAKQRKELSFLANTNRPAILLEICFVNSTVDAAIYRRDFEKICQAIANVLISHVGKPNTTKAVRSEVVELKLLSETGRSEIRDLLKTARDRKIIGSVHSDEKIEKYTDIELLSYQAAVVNRTFK